MRNAAPLLACTIVLAGCSTNDPNAVFEQVYGVANLPSTLFSIDATRDTVLRGPQGTVIHIPAAAFMDSLGNAVDVVVLELKEVLDPLSMVLANMTTTSGGSPLQTGGMLWLGASSGGRQLSLAPNKGINVAVPCDSIRTGMMRYIGSEIETGVDWIDPEPLIAIPVNKPSDERIQFMLDSIHQLKVTNIRYNVDGKFPTGVPECDSLVSAIAWAGDGLKIKKDSSFFFKGHRIDFVKSEEYKWNAVVGYTYSDTRALQKGTNWYLQDPNTHYLFEMKQLGWANIDRLYKDPRTEEVQFVTNVAGADDYPSLYVTLLIKDAGMYLPGYRMKNGSFSFSHGDNEAMQLPVGAEAIVLATAYKDGHPYFSFRKTTLQRNLVVDLHPTQTTMDRMKAELAENI